MFNRKDFDNAVASVAACYEKTAPTVEAWCDWLASAKDDKITIADLTLLGRLHSEKPLPAYAANLVYHRMTSAGLATTGHAGF